MKNKFFFIVVFVLLFALLINVSHAQIRDYDSTTGICYYSVSGCSDYPGPGNNIINCAPSDCDHSCVESELCCCEPCSSEGYGCSLDQDCNPGDVCTGFICSYNHCCPDGTVWSVDGCAEIYVTPSSRDFGEVLVGSCSSTQNFIVSNQGQGTLNGGVSVNAPFSCDSGCSYTLSAGQSQTVNIKFCPTSETYYSKTVSFSGGGGATATVTGEGNSPSVMYNLTVSKTGTGSGTVEGSGINCGSVCNKSYENGTFVTLYASAADGSTFDGWSGACSGTGNCELIMDLDKIVSAGFSSAPTGPYTLTVSKTGTGSGTVTSSPSGINCGSDCSEVYDENTVVTLSASAADGSTFSGWSGACSGTGTCELDMQSDKSATATFTLIPPSGECDLTSAAWSSTQVISGTTVEMNVEGTDCTDEALSFNIYRGSTYITTKYNIFPTSSWIANPASSTPYYFIAKVIDNPNETITSNNLLVKSGTIPNWCEIENITICGDYTNETTCNENTCNITIQDSLPNIDCSDPEITCYCEWENNECKGGWTGGDGGGLVKIEASPSSATINVEETQEFDAFAYYTDESKNKKIPSDNLVCSSSNSAIANRINTYGDYGCEFEGVSIGTVTITVKYTESDITKQDTATLDVVSKGSKNESHIRLIPDDKKIKKDETVSYTSILYWSDGSSDDVTVSTGFSSSNTTVASLSNNVATGLNKGFSRITGIYIGQEKTHEEIAFLGVTEYPDGVPVGKCTYTQFTDDNCDDGFLTFTWTAVWTWNPGCDAACQEENQALAAKCVDGQKTVECPAQIPLPFFNIYSFIATLVVIALIYTAIIISKKKKIRVRFES